MSVVYILAHFDDEYCALPLVWRAAREGLQQRFLYLADYRDRALGLRRFAESRALLAHEGVPPEHVFHIGADTGVFDGTTHRAAAQMFARVAEAVRGFGPVQRLVVPAWEGGHMDHDTCATIAVRLAPSIGAPQVRQFTLYNGLGMPGALLRGGAPLAQNGPVERIHLSPGEWLRWMGLVRFFPSQLYAWSGIWPAMFSGYALRGFGWQALAPERVLQRPHAGPLFYEKMFKVPYEEVRAALDAAFAADSRGSTAR